METEFERIRIESNLLEGDGGDFKGLGRFTLECHIIR